MTDSRPPIDLAERHSRVLFALLRPAVRLARRFRLPLKRLVELTRMAYYEELREHGGATQVEIGELLGVTSRTVANLAARYRSDFLAAEAEVALFRRVEDMLQAEELDLTGLQGALPSYDAVDLRRAVEGLVAGGRVERLGAGLFRARRDVVSRMRDDLPGKLDGLRHILEVLSSAVDGRIVGEDARPVLARTLTFVGTNEEMEELCRRLVAALRSECGDAEEKSLTAGGDQRFAVSLVLAPAMPTPRGSGR